MKTHKDLDVWKDSIVFVKDIYSVTNIFPKSELYGIVSQIRRSAVSVPTNIAEGAGRQYAKESIQFFYISLGSLTETETLLIISKELLFLKDEDFEIMEVKLTSIRKQLLGLIKYYQKKQVE